MSDHYNKRKVGIYEDANRFYFYPDTSNSLIDEVNVALYLRSIARKEVYFMYPNIQYKILMSLYARELRRKFKPSELVKLHTRKCKHTKTK